MNIESSRLDMHLTFFMATATAACTSLKDTLRAERRRVTTAYLRQIMTRIMVGIMIRLMIMIGSTFD
jgi:hypothetical protein